MLLKASPTSRLVTARCGVMQDSAIPGEVLSCVAPLCRQRGRGGVIVLVLKPD